MDSGRTAAHVDCLHFSDQLTRAYINSWPPRLRASVFQAPVKAEALPMPTYDGIRLQAVDYFTSIIQIS